MSENVENLALEHLRSIRADMPRMADGMRTMQAEMTAMRQSLSSVSTLQDRDHGDIAGLKLRIERRLDRVE